MIYDLLDNAGLYGGVHSKVAEAAAFVKSLEADAPDGKTVLDGDSLFAMVMGYETTPAETRKYEAHQRYIDMQVVLGGVERLDVTHETGLKVVKPYDGEADVELYDAGAEDNSVILRPGCFTLLFPHDIHRPGCNWQEACAVRKVVVKIRV